VHILAFDAIGELRGRGAIANPAKDALNNIGDADAPQIVASPAGSALLTWVEQTGQPVAVLRRAVITEDGALAGPPTTLMNEVNNAGSAEDRASAFVDGGYLVASLTPTSTASTVKLVRVESGGAIGHVTTLPADYYASPLAFASYSSHAHLFFWTQANTDFSLNWVDVGRDGAVLAGPKTIEHQTFPYRPAAAAQADRTVLLTGSRGPLPSDTALPIRVTARAVDSSGRPVGTPFLLASSGRYVDAYDLRVVAGQAVAAWVTDAIVRPQIYLAELRP
jgi:hypothetical protein